MIGEVVRTVRSFLIKDTTARLRRLEAEADSSDEEHSIAQYIAAIEFWEAGQLSTAYRFAERLLRAEPKNFRMLVIGADYHLSRGDLTGTYEYAVRLCEAENPAPEIRRRLKRWRPVHWCLNAIKPRNNLAGWERDAVAFDEWEKWARDHVARATSATPQAAI